MTGVGTRVRTLLGERGFDLSCICLKSLLEYSADPISLIIHEDGTLTDLHRDRLREIDPDVLFIHRAASDERVLGRLARYPRCLAFRKREIMALKLFDILAYADQWTIYCDSDFLYLRRFTKLFRPPSSGLPVFMTDSGHSYAVRPWCLSPLGPVRLLGKLNAGFTVAPTSLLDLDYLEWLLGVLEKNAVFSRRRYWTEQTCWAALASRAGGAELLDPCQIVMATRAMGRYSSNAVAIHFVATYRGLLPEYLSRQRPMDEAAVATSAAPASRVGPVGMMISDILRRLRG